MFFCFYSSRVSLSFRLHDQSICHQDGSKLNILGYRLSLSQPATPRIVCLDCSKLRVWFDCYRSLSSTTNLELKSHSAGCNSIACIDHTSHGRRRKLQKPLYFVCKLTTKLPMHAHAFEPFEKAKTLESKSLEKSSWLCFSQLSDFSPVYPSLQLQVPFPCGPRTSNNMIKPSHPAPSDRLCSVFWKNDISQALSKSSLKINMFLIQIKHH